MLANSDPVVAPLVLDPLAARLAEDAGFRALYLGGGALGFLKCVTEANLTLTEMVQLGLEIRSVCALPLILDGAGGWGDPMHMHRTIGMTEAAGFAAIEIEDQLLPKRAHHHIGIEHLIPKELMVAKIRECAAARRNPDFVIIGRTNAARTDGIDEAVRRAEAYRNAGADLLFVLQKRPEDIRFIADRVGGPLMFMPTGEMWSKQFTLSELDNLGYRLIVDAVSPLLASYAALRNCYQAMADRTPIDIDSRELRKQILTEIQDTVGLSNLLDIESRTVET